MEKYHQERKSASARFLKSYLLDKELSNLSEDEEDNLVPSVAPCGYHSFDDGDLLPGQVRLLSNTERPTYVLLLRRWTDESFVVMPYSPYDDPATDEEFKSEWDGGQCLRVLQVWNVRTLQDASLKKSWLIGSQDEQDVEEAWHVWQAVLGATKLEDSLLKRTGYPIFSEEDARLQYKQEELANFALQDAVDLVIAEHSFVVLSPSQSRAALAAGGEEEELSKEGQMEEKAVTIMLRYVPGDSTVFLDIYDEKGERTTLLDGSVLVPLDNIRTVLGTIENGVLEASCPSNLAESVCLLDKEGTPLSITWR